MTSRSPFTVYRLRLSGVRANRRRGRSRRAEHAGRWQDTGGFRSYLWPPSPIIPSTMSSAILFDFNGVIIDDEPQHCDALIATLAEYGVELDRDRYYREYLGFDDRECFRFTFDRLGRPLDERGLAEAIERKNAHYERALRASMRLVPGAADFVEE